MQLTPRANPSIIVRQMSGNERRKMTFPRSLLEGFLDPAGSLRALNDEDAAPEVATSQTASRVTPDAEDQCERLHAAAGELRVAGYALAGMQRLGAVDEAALQAVGSIAFRGAFEIEKAAHMLAPEVAAALQD